MLKRLPRELLIALRVTLVIAAIGGLVYPLAMTGIAHAILPDQADGSLIKASNGAVVGSSLIGQCFYQPNRARTNYLTAQFEGETIFAVDPRYFQSRPSFTTDQSGSPLPCNAQSSGGSNLAASNPALIKRIDVYADYLHCLGIQATVPFAGSQLVAVAADPARYCRGAASDTTPLPVDLVTGDFSGFDPDISQAAALAQVDMVASARGIDASMLRQLVDANVTGRSLGVFGESYVDVLQLNLAVNREFGQPAALR